MNHTATAYHEASHAVAFHRLFPEGRYGFVLTIVPNAERGTLGSHSAEELLDCTDEEQEAEAIYSCGGYAGVLVAGYSVAEAEAGCESDFDLAVQYSRRPLNRLKQEAVTLLSRPENRRALDRLAAELLQRGTLDWDWAVNLLNLVDGKLTETQYQAYLAMRNDV